MRTIMRAALGMSLVLMLTPCTWAQWPLGGEMMRMPKSEPSPTVTVNGRFQIFTSPNEKGETFMIDTDTGKVWILEKDTTSGAFVLKRIRVEEVDPAKTDLAGDKKTQVNK